MHPRTSIFQAVPGGILFHALWMLSACSPLPELPAETPNVLLLTVDTLRADHLGFYGYDRPTSPRLDAFAATATVFENAQASASWTLPGMASIFTSTYTSTHACWTLGSRLDESFITLPERLTAAGFDSAAIGSHIFCTPRFGLSQGFVHLDFELANAGGDPEKATTSHLIADRGIRFLEQKSAAPDGSPWLLWLHFFDPHGEYLAQKGFTELFVEPGAAASPIDLYDGEIAYTDAHIGRVLDALESTGFARDTLVIFVADHGEEFFEHGGVEHGRTLFDEQLHVPFVLRVPPARDVTPRRVSALVRTVDIFPTLLELLNLPPEPAVAGISLIPLIRSGSGDTHHALPAFAELGMAASEELAAIHDGRFKLIQRRNGGEALLFDMQSDPLEKHNLSDERSEELLRLEKELERIRERARARAGLYSTSTAAIPPAERDRLGGLGYVEDGS